MAVASAVAWRSLQRGVGKADLHSQGVSSMAASVDDVEGRHWQNLHHHRTL